MAGDRVTRPSDDAADVAAILERADGRRREQAEEVLGLMRRTTGAEPVAWGTMIGFGRRAYTTADGKEHETFTVGLAPRKAALTLYGLTDGATTDLIDRLGPHKSGKGCLYLTRLDDVDRDVLTELVARAWAARHEAGE